MNELLLKPVLIFQKLVEMLRLKIVQTNFLLVKLAILFALFFVQVLQAICCLPAYIFIDREVFDRIGKHQFVSQNAYGFRRFFVLSGLFFVIFIFLATFVFRSFFGEASSANLVSNYCYENMKGVDLFFSYYPPSNLAIFVVGISFFVFLMVRLGIFSSKKLPHEA
jgi:hypothetical protein